MAEVSPCSSPLRDVSRGRNDCRSQANPTGATAAKPEARVPAINSHPRVVTQSQMETLCLAYLWKEKLTAMGWDRRPASELSINWATSTLSLYNRMVNDFYSSCSSNGLPFPPDDPSIIAPYMCHVADKSPRPQSLLKTTIAALHHLYNALDQPSPLDCEEIT